MFVSDLHFGSDPVPGSDPAPAYLFNTLFNTLLVHIKKNVSACFNSHKFWAVPKICSDPDPLSFESRTAFDRIQIS
jgi:hypothetical protein